MNKWLERALVSAGAAVVSTTALVTTAEKDGNKRKKKGKRKKGKKGEGDSSRGTDGALIDDEVPRSIGAQAAYDYRKGHDGGLTGAEFLDNVRDAGSKAARGVSGFGKLLFSRAPSAPPGEEGDEPAPKKRRRKKVRRRVRRKKGEADAPRPSDDGGPKKKKRRKKRRGEPERDEFDELRDEAAKAARRAAAKGVADKVGMGDTVSSIKEQSKELWEKTEKLSSSVRDRVPEDLGKRIGESFEEAGRSIKDGTNKLADRVRDAVGEDEETGEDIGDKVERGIRGVMRWVEGPGAPKYEAAPKPKRVKVTQDGDDEDEVDAKEPPGDPEPVEAKADDPPEGDEPPPA